MDDTVETIMVEGVRELASLRRTRALQWALKLTDAELVKFFTEANGTLLWHHDGGHVLNLQVRSILRSLMRGARHAITVPGVDTMVPGAADETDLQRLRR